MGSTDKRFGLGTDDALTPRLRFPFINFGTAPVSSTLIAVIVLITQYNTVVRKYRNSIVTLLTLSDGTNFTTMCYSLSEEKWCPSEASGVLQHKPTLL
jgi:hypothetical protein